MFRSLMPFGRPLESGSADNPIVSLQRQVNSLFEHMFHGIPVFSRNGGSVFEPSMDVKETDKAIEVEAELPGVDQKDVQVTVEDGTLTVKGEKKSKKRNREPVTTCPSATMARSSVQSGCRPAWIWKRFPRISPTACSR